MGTEIVKKLFTVILLHGNLGRTVYSECHEAHRVTCNITVNCAHVQVSLFLIPPLEVMAVEEEWLPLLQPQFCVFSSPLEHPPPFFDSRTGTVRCYMSCTYGQCLLECALHSVSFSWSFLC